jgi:sugar O-acyltransferase (sialic acid O-acetyltransferase NeuD family)
MLLGIYGSGGLGCEIYEIAIRYNTMHSSWDKILFIDDINEEGNYFGTERIKFDTLLKNKDDYECIVAVGEPSTREKLYDKLINESVKITSLVDLTSIISPTSKIGLGTIICEFSTIHTGVEIGQNVLIQPFCDIGHDIKIGDHTVISPHCAPGGSTVFGKRVYAGMQSTIKEKLIIGDDAIIAMGSSLFLDTPAGSTVLGNPARVTRGNAEHKVFK